MTQRMIAATAAKTGGERKGRKASAGLAFAWPLPLFVAALAAAD
jgi:hypothetical protein